MIDKLKNFGYNLVNDNQTKALVASVVINIILIISLLSILITGNVPGHSNNSAGDTEITECTLEHVSSTKYTTTTTTTTTSTTNRTTARQQGNNNNYNNNYNNNNATTAKTTTTTKKAATTTKAKTTTKAATTTTANLDNDGEWVEGWY